MGRRSANEGKVWVKEGATEGKEKQKGNGEKISGGRFQTCDQGGRRQRQNRGLIDSNDGQQAGAPIPQRKRSKTFPSIRFLTK